MAKKKQINRSVAQCSTRTGKEEAFKAIEKFLSERKIKSERVLGYVCYHYKGQDYRAQTVLDVKKIMGYAI